MSDARISKMWEESDKGAREIMSNLRAEIERLREECEYKWISVEDKLPEESESYLVYLGNRGYINKIDVDYYSTLLGTFANGNDVTHWMPLPEPPETD